MFPGLQVVQIWCLRHIRTYASVYEQVGIWFDRTVVLHAVLHVDANSMTLAVGVRVTVSKTWRLIFSGIKFDRSSRLFSVTGSSLLSTL